MCYCHPEIKPAGWYLDIGMRQSCDVTCGNRGLVCTEDQLMAHNGDVDTGAELNKLVERVAGASTLDGVWQPKITCNKYLTGHGSNKDVPTYNSGACYVSSA